MVRFRTLLPVALVASAGVVALAACDVSFDENVFAVTFVNDTAQKLSIGLCTDETCQSGSREYTDGVKPGTSIEANVNGDANIVNAFLITNRSGDKVGCFLLHYHGKLTGRIAYRLSTAPRCPPS